MNETLLVDTGFWIALFDPRESRHNEADEKADYLETLRLVVPWPLVYETLRTRFVRRPDWVARLDDVLKQPTVEFVDDAVYREEAYSLAIEYSTHLKRPISMVDMLCRLLIADQNVNLDYLLTINPADYVDVCGAHNVEML